MGGGGCSVSSMGKLRLLPQFFPLCLLSARQWRSHCRFWNILPPELFQAAGCMGRPRQDGVLGRLQILPFRISSAPSFLLVPLRPQAEGQGSRQFSPPGKLTDDVAEFVHSWQEQAPRQPPGPASSSPARPPCLQQSPGAMQVRPPHTLPTRPPPSLTPSCRLKLRFYVGLVGARASFCPALAPGCVPALRGAAARPLCRLPRLRQPSALHGQLHQ